MTVTRFSNGAIRDNLLTTNTSFAASDMELISTIRVGSGGASSVTFSNIPQEYKHLQIRSVSRSSRASVSQDDLYAQLNGDTGTNYSWHYLNGTGSAAGSASGTSATLVFAGWTSASTATASIFGTAVLDILDYSNTSKYKTVRSLSGWDGNGSGNVGLLSGSWRNLNAVTSISFTNSNSHVQYSRFSLYGIRG